MVLLITTAFVLGLGGSLHCLGMCGPLVISIPFTVKENHNYFSVAAYFISKALGYGLMGFIMGSIGCGFSFIEWQQALSIICGIFILLIAFYPVLQHRFLGSYSIQKPLQKIFAKMQAQPKWYYFAAFGFVNAYLPCGLVFTALAGATVTATATNGFLFMFFFGIGTVPALAATLFFKNKISFNYRQYFQKTAHYLAVLMGVILIIRGLNLGIPYISPASDTAGNIKSCCKK